MTLTWLSPRLRKEARSLLWPWGVAVAASLAALNSFGEFAEGVRMLCLWVSVALFASLSFGAEFQLRTLPLLLSQPIERSRIWKEKFLVLAVGAGVIILANCRNWLWLGHLRFWELAFLGGIGLAMVTSSGFWIRVTRSEAAGITCGVLGQLLIFFVMVPIGIRALYAHYPLQVAGLLGEHKPQLAGAFGVYALSFAWFGRRFWKSHLRGLAVAVIIIAAILGLGRCLADLGGDIVSTSGKPPLDFMFVLVTVFSAGFWALTARSVIGGMVFCTALQLMGAVLVLFGASKLAGPLGVEEEKLVAVAIGVGGLAFAGLFLWLGWREFARLELRDAVFGEGIERAGMEVLAGWRPRWLGCRADAPFLNLIRKELRLQKPIFLTAALFLLCWGVGWTLNRLWPQRGYDPILEWIPLFYAPIILLLAGSASLSDEKTLGVAGWQLALPVSTRRLWAVKLGMANVTGLALGLVLPGLLMWLAAAGRPDSQVSPGAHGAVLAGACLGACLLILVAFWASTLTSNFIRAALTTIVAAAAGAGGVALGIWAHASVLDNALQIGLLQWVLTHYHLPPDSLARGAVPFSWLVLGLAAVLGVFLLLRQSLSLFRVAELSRRRCFKYWALLAALLVVCPFWLMDFYASARSCADQPQSELVQALNRLRSQHLAPNTPGVVSLAQLEATGGLSESTKTWLTGAVIRYGPDIAAAPTAETDETFGSRFGLNRAWRVHIDFPGGRQYTFENLWRQAPGR